MNAQIWAATEAFLELTKGHADIVEAADLEEFAELRERIQTFGAKYAPPTS